MFLFGRNSIFICFLWRDLVFAMDFVRRSSIVVCSLYRYLVFTTFLFAHRVIECCFQRLLRTIGWRDLPLSLGVFVMNSIASWGFTMWAPTFWPLLLRILNRSGSMQADPSAQHSSCCYCWRQLTGSQFSLPTLNDYASANHYGGTDDNYLFHGASHSCALFGIANNWRFCFGF